MILARSPADLPKSLKPPFALERMIFNGRRYFDFTESRTDWSDSGGLLFRYKTSPFAAEPGMEMTNLAALGRKGELLLTNDLLGAQLVLPWQPETPRVAGVHYGTMLMCYAATTPDEFSPAPDLGSSGLARRERFEDLVSDGALRQKRYVLAVTRDGYELEWSLARHRDPGEVPVLRMSLPGEEFEDPVELMPLLRQVDQHLATQP